MRILRLALASLVLLLSACPAPSKEQARAETPDTGVVMTAAIKPVRTSTAVQHSGQRFRECHVYLDGTPVASLTWGELPPNVIAIWHTIKDGRKYRRFGMASYLEGLGVNLKKLKEVHLYGGRTRACIVGGDQIRKFKDEIQIAFTQDKRGQPLIYWPAGIKINDAIDQVSRVAIYVEKKPPKWNKKEYVLELDGERLEDGEVPYSNQEMRAGARVYIDGVLATILKRNKLEAAKSSSIAEKNPALPLLLHLASLGKNIDGIQSADIVDDELYIARLDKKALDALSFSLIDNSGGEVLLHPLEKRATAVLLYARRTPADFEKR